MFLTDLNIQAKLLKFLKLNSITIKYLLSTKSINCIQFSIGTWQL